MRKFVPTDGILICNVNGRQAGQAGCVCFVLFAKSIVCAADTTSDTPVVDDWDSTNGLLGEPELFGVSAISALNKSKRLVKQWWREALRCLRTNTNVLTLNIVVLLLVHSCLV